MDSVPPSDSVGRAMRPRRWRDQLLQIGTKADSSYTERETMADRRTKPSSTHLPILPISRAFPFMYYCRAVVVGYIHILTFSYPLVNRCSPVHVPVTLAAK